MSIYEYDQEEHIRLEREDAFEDGHKAGREEGLEEGREEGIELGSRKKMMKYVERMLEKGFSIPEIADMLGEKEEIIGEIVKSLENFCDS